MACHKKNTSLLASFIAAFISIGGLHRLFILFFWKSDILGSQIVIRLPNYLTILPNAQSEPLGSKRGRNTLTHNHEGPSSLCSSSASHLLVMRFHNARRG